MRGKMDDDLIVRTRPRRAASLALTTEPPALVQVRGSNWLDLDTSYRGFLVRSLDLDTSYRTSSALILTHLPRILP